MGAAALPGRRIFRGLGHRLAGIFAAHPDKLRKGQSIPSSRPKCGEPGKVRNPRR